MDVKVSGRVEVGPAQGDFDDVLTTADPTAFFGRLSQLDYRVPAYTATLLRNLLAALSDQDNLVVDVCSSYGANAALINHSLTLSGLYDHYRPAPRVAPDSHEGPDRHGGPDRHADIGRRFEEDGRFFTTTRRRDAVPVVGVDASAAAIDYGTAVGLLAGGIASDFEQDRPDGPASEWLRRTTLISASNRVGHVSSRTFVTLVGASARPPVIAGFFLRWQDVRPIAQSLAVAGYEFRADYRLVYPQRRFTSVIDQRAALAGLKRLGLAETAVERNGYHGVVPYVAFPRSLRQRAAVIAAFSLLEPPAW